MRTIFGLPFLIAALSTLVLAPAPAPAADDEVVEVTHDGLHLVPDTEVAMAWVKPGADFSRYERVLLLDTYVAFRQGWERDQRRGSVQRVRNRDIERMKSDLSEMFREVFERELSRDDGFPVAKGADDDVLLLRPAIIDLDVTAPDVSSAGRSRTYAASAGAATLFLELYDSVSGEILARVLDRRADDNIFMRWTTRATNRAAAQGVLTQWARLLRQGMDEVHGRGAD